MARWQKRDDDGGITFDTGESSFKFGKTMTDEKLGKLATEILSYLGCSFEIRWPGLEPTDKQRADAHQRLVEDAEGYARRVSWDADDRPVIESAYKAGWRASPKPVNSPIR